MNKNIFYAFFIQSLIKHNETVKFHSLKFITENTNHEEWAASEIREQPTSISFYIMLFAESLIQLEERRQEYQQREA